MYDEVSPSISAADCPTTSFEGVGARRSKAHIAFGATGTVGVVISVAAAIGSFIMTALIMRVLFDVVESFAARYKCMKVCARVCVCACPQRRPGCDVSPRS